MAGIFISYRREDAAGWTGRLADDLRRAFPAHEVFYDIATIAIGEDFVKAMRRALGSCAIVIVVIGPHWQNAKDESGNRRLDDPEDWVRLEVAESLRRKALWVVPVLVGGATMPKGSDLPEPLKQLARRNAHEISDKRWDYDVAQLIGAIKQLALLPGAPSGGAPAHAAHVAEVIRAEEPVVPIPVEGLPGTVFRDCDDCPEMVVIPAGEFKMGSPRSEKGRDPQEGPQHDVKIARPFALGRYETTVAEFARFVAATDYKTDADRDPDHQLQIVDSDGLLRETAGNWRAPGFTQGERHPVVGVSWNDAIAYTKWLSEKTGREYRLPSEAEWEYAARAGAMTPYPWGDTAGWEKGNFPSSGSQWGGKQTALVGSFEANAFGLHDMIGNVSEWVQDEWHRFYRGAPEDGSAWESGESHSKVVRGGNWATEYPRVATRINAGDWVRRNNCGFRVARAL